MNPPTKPRIGAYILATHMVMWDVLQEIIMDVSPNNKGINRTQWRISNTGVDGMTSFYYEISWTSIPSPIDNRGTRINVINVTCTPAPSGISGTIDA